MSVWAHCATRMTCNHSARRQTECQSIPCLAVSSFSFRQMLCISLFSSRNTFRPNQCWQSVFIFSFYSQKARVDFIFRGVRFRWYALHMWANSAHMPGIDTLFLNVVSPIHDEVFAFVRHKSEQTRHAHWNWNRFFRFEVSLVCESSPDLLLRSLVAATAVKE